MTKTTASKPIPLIAMDSLIQIAGGSALIVFPDPVKSGHPHLARPSYSLVDYPHVLPCSEVGPVQLHPNDPISSGPGEKRPYNTCNLECLSLPIEEVEQDW